jgi:hypothetical protein
MKRTSHLFISLFHLLMKLCLKSSVIIVLILVNFYIFIVKPRLKIGNKRKDDITREDFNKEVLALRMYDVNNYKKRYLI